MQKFHTYWHALRASIADPEYYFSLSSTRIWFSIQFFVCSLFLIALSVIPRLIFRDIPQTIADIQTESVRLVEQLPQDAVFSYTGDDMQFHGVTTPLTIHATDRMLSLGYPKDLIIIQATDSASLAVLTLTPKHVYLTIEGSDPTQFSYADIVGDLRGDIARDQIRSSLSRGLDEIVVNRVAIAGVIACGIFFGSIFNGIFTIFFYSLVVQILGWVMGLRLRYFTAVRWGTHMFPIAYGIQEISRWTVRGSTFPILAVSYIAIALLIIWTGKRSRPTIKL